MIHIVKLMQGLFLSSNEKISTGKLRFKKFTSLQNWPKWVGNLNLQITVRYVRAIFHDLRNKIFILLKSRFTCSNAITINPSISYMHYFLAAFSGNPLPKVTWWHSGVIFDSTDEIPRSRGGSIIGQAHDMFSRIFSIRFYEFFLRNIVWFFFLKCSKLRIK